MNCALCRKSIKRDTVKCIPYDKHFHPGCVMLHKVPDDSGNMVPCKGEVVKVPRLPVEDVFVDASPVLSLPAVTSTATTTAAGTVMTTTTTTTVAASTSTLSSVCVPLANSRPSYRTTATSMSILPPAPTTDLSQLCADVRAVLMSQSDIKTLHQANTVKLNQCTEFMREQKVHNASIETSIASLTADINQKFTNIAQGHAEVTARLNTLEASFAELKSRVDNAPSASVLPPSTLPSVDTFREMSVRLQKLEHEQATRDLLISGLPERLNEHLPSLAIRISEVLQVQLSVCDIVSVRRLPGTLTRTQTTEDLSVKPRAILLRLGSFSLKKALLAARKRRGRLTAKEVNDSFPERVIWLNDFLPKETWLLLKKVRSVAREKNFKFCWCSQGTIFVKKDTNSTPIRIHTEKDIESKLS